MLELSAIKFQVDTTELERAQKSVAALVQDFAKIDKASQQSARVQAQTEAILAKAAKEHAQARLENAKAADQELKSTITADKADQAREKSIKKSTEATERQTTATQKSVSILERQKDILEFQTEGYSKGQSSILAYGKAAGLAADELQELAKVLDTQRKLMGSDPFDKSLSGLKSLQNQYTELREALRQYNSGSDLTAKQTKELARDKERLIERMKVEGSSFQSIRQAVRAYNQEFVGLASQYNKLASAEENVIKQRREVVNATNYVTQADQKMAAALNISNAAIDKAGTDSLVKYENALRKSGMAQDVVTQKLATYKTQLAQVQAAEEARKTANLTRAISPQITDIAVSLYSGQAPLTVLLQQGGQLADIFRLSGVEAGNLGKLMKDSFYSMIPVIKEVGAALGGLVFGMVADLSKATVNAIAGFTGISFAVDKMKQAIVAGGEANFKYIATLDRIGAAASKLATTGVLALITVLVAVALEYKKIIATEKELSIALATSGGALALSKDEAVKYAESLQSLGIGTQKAVSAITEFARAGKVGKEGLDELIKASLDFEKYAGVAVSDTAKQYAKLQEEPTKALTEIAEKTGLVDKATLDLVFSLEHQGQKAEAARIATQAYTNALNASTSEIKGNLSPVEKLWDDIKGAIGRVKQEIYDLATSNAIVSTMRTIWETISVVVAETWFTIKGVGKEIGGIAAQIGAVLRGDFAGAKSIGDQMKIDAASARAEQEKLIQAILNRGKTEEGQHQQRKQENSEYAGWLNDNAKALEKQYSKDEKYAQRKLQLQSDLKSGLIDEIKYNEALAGWKRIIYGDKKEKVDKQPIKDLETQVDLWNKSIGLSATYNNEYKAILRQYERGVIDQEEFNQLFDALLAKQPVMLEHKKEENAAHELSNKLLGKAEGLGKDYYKTLEKIAEYASKGFYTPEQIEALKQAAYAQTELAKEQLKFITSSAREYEKFGKNTQKVTDETIKQNAELDARVELLGLTSDEQQRLLIQQKQQGALLEEELKLQRDIAAIRLSVQEGKMDPFSAELAILEREKAAAEQRKAINREVAIAYAEDLDKELRKIKEGVSDSIVTALFEGGKSGSQKLRSVVVDALKKPINVVVNAIVNTLLGNTSGSLGGNAGGILGALTGGGGNILNAISGGLNIAGLGGGMIATRLGGYLANMGLETVSELVGQFGAGMLNTSSIGGFMGAFRAGGANLAGAVVGSVLNGFTGYSLSKLISGGYQLNKYVDKIAGVASAIPGIGPIAGVVGGVVNRLFGRKLKESGIEGTFGGESGFEGRTYQYYKGGLFRSSKTRYGELDEETRSGFAESFTDLKSSITDMATTLGLGTDSIKDFTYSFKINLMGLSEEEATKKLAEEFTAMSNSIAAVILTTDEYTKGEETRIETLSRLATSLSSVNTIFQNMGMTLLQVSLQGADAADQLVEAFGGIDSFTSTMSEYYGAFYSEAEQQNLLQQQLTRSFAQLNLTLPTTREQFRQLVESQDLMTESGRAAYVALLGLSDGFLAFEEAYNEPLRRAAEEAAEAQKQRAEQEKKTIEDLTQRGYALEADLAELNGDLDGATARRYWLETQGMTQAELAAYDYNQALIKQIDAAKEMAQVAQQFANTINNLSNTRFDLENQLLALTGKDSEVASRTREKDLAELTKGLDEEQAKKVREAYDYNVALRNQIKLQQEANNAAQNAASAAASAADKVRSSWQSVVDSLLAQVDRLRGAIAEDSPQSTQYYSALYQQTLARALSGDVDAAGALSGVTDSYVKSAEGSSSSLGDLQALRALLANDLELLARVAGTKQGVVVTQPTTSSSVSVPSSSSLSAGSGVSTSQVINIVGLSKVEELINKTNSLLDNIRSTNKDTRDIVRETFDGDSIAVRLVT